MNKLTHEQFDKMWEDSTKEEVLFQFYYDYYAKVEALDKIDKVIEYIEGVNYNNKVASAYEDNNTTECTKKDIIEQEIRHDNYILSILRGEDNE